MLPSNPERVLLVISASGALGGQIFIGGRSILSDIFIPISASRKIELRRVDWGHILGEPIFYFLAIPQTLFFLEATCVTQFRGRLGC